MLIRRKGFTATRHSFMIAGSPAQRLSRLKMASVHLGLDYGEMVGIELRYPQNARLRNMWEALRKVV